MDQHLAKILFLSLLLFHSISSALSLDRDLINRHVGCFSNDASNSFLPLEIKDSHSQGSVSRCVEACTKVHNMFAGIQNGSRCFCGADHSGAKSSTACNIPCSNESGNYCGGEDAIVVYKTDVDVPGPPKNLTLLANDEMSLTLSWEAPEGFQQRLILDYHVIVDFEWSFDKTMRSMGPKKVQLSGLKTRIIGLRPGSKYRVTVFGASGAGEGEKVSNTFWTEIAEPLPPPAPKLIQHADSSSSGDDHDHDHHEDPGHGHGEIHLQLLPLAHNPGGPVSSYRVVVMNESARAPFDRRTLSAWRQGAAYWVAAEIGPEWFEHHKEFVAGDDRRYGQYLNYGPLDAERYDFHFTVGAVSTLNGTTKISYAQVDHDQHAKENIVVFRFHDHGQDAHHHHHGDDHGHLHHPLVPYLPAGDGDSRSRRPHGSGAAADDGVLTAVLGAAVAVVALLIVAAVAFYLYLRLVHEPRRSLRNGGGWSEAQELTQTQATDAESQASSHDHAASLASSPPSPSAAMLALRERVWQIPRNFLHLSGEVVGRGSFGSVIRGAVDVKGRQEAAIVQVASESLHSRGADESLAKSIGIVADCSEHPNVLALIGLCGGGLSSEAATTDANASTPAAALYVVLQDGSTSLKQALLDSRWLEHDPAAARRAGRASAIADAQLLTHAVELASAMEYLASKKIVHRKLCARSASLHRRQGPHQHPGQATATAKLCGFGIVDFSRGGHDVDPLRWQAHEMLYGRQPNTKSDVWAFGVLLWELFTLGGTPYSDLSSSAEVASQVCRGRRLPSAAPHFSEDVHSLMLDCWQVDMDERPTFAEVHARLTALKESQQPVAPVDHTITDNYKYEPFSNELELRMY